MGGGVVDGGRVGGGVVGGRGASTDLNEHLNPRRLGLCEGPAWKNTLAKFEDI